jgi:hypothetical protein
MAAQPFRGKLTGMGVDASSTNHPRHFGGSWGAAGALGAARLVVAARRVGRPSGVSTAELHAALPGDDLVPQPVWTSISAQPERVWPWVIQWLIIGPLIAVGDFVNASNMLRGIRRRAERRGQPRQVPVRQER